MKLIYSNFYKKLCNLENYPLVGYWYSVVELNLDIHKNTYYQFYNDTLSGDFQSRIDWLTKDSETTPGVLHKTNTYLPSISNLHKANVILKDNKYYLSITLPDELVDKKIGFILVYAIDLLKYKDGNIVSDSSSSQFDYIINTDNISLILAPPTTGDVDQFFNNKVTNIIDLLVYPKCSFLTSLQSASNQDNMTHYLFGEIDRGTLFDAMVTANKFIELYSGLDRTRALLGTDRPGDLKGHLTIGTNGVIHL